MSMGFSTNAPLGAGETWGSGWYRSDDSDSITVAGLTDQAGTVYLEFSADQENVDSSVAYPVAANVDFFNRLTVFRTFCRVRFVNDGDAQSFLRIQVLLGDKQIVSSPLHLSASRTADAIVTKSFDAELLIPLGLVGGWENGTKFGVNPDIDNGSEPEDVWNGGGEYTGHPDGAAETVEVFSDSADDAAAGTGARTVRLIGLDANWVEQTVDVTLNGTTAVATTETWRRLPRAYVLTAGSGGGNAGTITIRHTTTTANVFAAMPPMDNQTLICALTVPDGKTMLIRRISAQLTRNSTSGAADISLRVREPGGVFRKRREYQISGGSGVDRHYEGGLVVPERSDVKIRVEDVTANNTAVEAEIDYFLFTNVS